MKIARPMWPFYTAGLVVAWGISSFAGFYMNSTSIFLTTVCYRRMMSELP